MADKQIPPSPRQVAPTPAGGKTGNQLSGKDELPILSRRNFLKASGVAAAGAIGLASARCGAPEPDHTLPNATVSKISIAQQYPAVLYTPTELLAHSYMMGDGIRDKYLRDPNRIIG